MSDKTNKKHILIFLAFAFGIAWTSSLVIYRYGGLENSPIYEISGVKISLAMILLSTIYMFSPAIANILTRCVTKEGKTDLKLTPYFSQRRWFHYLAGWVLPGLLTIAGAFLFFLLFPKYYDPKISILRTQLSSATNVGNVSPWFIAVVQTLQAILFSPILNAIPCFGEEFGWRGYLQPKLLPLGRRKAILLTGIIWGIWHWPIILMGHNYGKEYFGAPFLGPLAMVWFTIGLSAIFGWLTIKAENIWPAVIAHGAWNGIAAIGLLFVQGNPDPLLGPLPVGIIGGVGLIIVAGLIFLLPHALEPIHDEVQEVQQEI